MREKVKFIIIFFILTVAVYVILIVTVKFYIFNQIKNVSENGGYKNEIKLLNESPELVIGKSNKIKQENNVTDEYLSGCIFASMLCDGEQENKTFYTLSKEIMCQGDSAENKQILILAFRLGIVSSCNMCIASEIENAPIGMLYYRFNELLDLLKKAGFPGGYSNEDILCIYEIIKHIDSNEVYNNFVKKIHKHMLSLSNETELECAYFPQDILLYLRLYKLSQFIKSSNSTSYYEYYRIFMKDKVDLISNKLKSNNYYKYLFIAESELRAIHTLKTTMDVVCVSIIIESLNRSDAGLIPYDKNVLVTKFVEKLLFQYSNNIETNEKIIRYPIPYKRTGLPYMMSYKW